MKSNSKTDSRVFLALSIAILLAAGFVVSRGFAGGESTVTRERLCASCLVADPLEAQQGASLQ
jgi:hypothetical protein